MEFFFASVSLLIVTIVSSILYYRRIKLAQNEYQNSKDLVKNIVFGFTSQITRFTSSLKRIENETISTNREAQKALQTGNEAYKLADEGYKEVKQLSNRLDLTEKTMESIKAEIQKLKQVPRPSTTQEDLEAPIPLQQENVLDQLTRTEVMVLTIIEELGEGAVPEIREKIKKTREHTARLLKKLYEKGFIDRNTKSMPYKYYIRREIKELVQEHKKEMKISV